MKWRGCRLKHRNTSFPVYLLGGHVPEAPPPLNTAGLRMGTSRVPTLNTLLVFGFWKDLLLLLDFYRTLF